MANSNNPTPVTGYTLPEIHVLDTVTNGVGSGYKLYGRDAGKEMAAGLNNYASNASLWASTNLTLGGSLVSNLSNYAGSLRPLFVSGLGSAALALVPTETAQTTRLSELALAAKAILEDPEIDPTENAQLAAGMSAAMGGGHSAVPAIKDNITFEQKLKAKTLALDSYTKALGEYFKLTTMAAQLAGNASENAAKTAQQVPVVAPFESQLTADVLSNWQDSLNTGQVRDQQIRQTVAAGHVISQFGPTGVSNQSNIPGINFDPGTWNASLWNAEFTTAYLGIRSQATAATTI